MPSLKILIGLAVMLPLMTYMCWYLYSDYSERQVDYTPKMQNFFKLHESELDELVKITEAEPKVFHVDVVSQAVPEALPPKKIQEVRSRLTKLGLFAVMTVSPEIRLFGRDGKRLAVGRITGTWTYCYAHVPERPKKTVGSLNEITPQDGIGYVPLKKDWYLIGFFGE